MYCIGKYMYREIQKLKLLENMEVSHFRLFLTPGIDFLGKNTSEMVYLKFFEKNFFRPQMR